MVFISHKSVVCIVVPRVVFWNLFFASLLAGSHPALLLFVEGFHCVGFLPDCGSDYGSVVRSFKDVVDDSNGSGISGNVE